MVSHKTARDRTLVDDLFGDDRGKEATAAVIKDTKYFQPDTLNFSVICSRAQQRQRQNLRRRANKSCEEGGSFSITAPSNPSVDGCYVWTGDEVDGQAFYASLDGATDGSSINVMVAVPGDRTDPSDVHWVLGFVDTRNTDKDIAFCFSVDRAGDRHPADVKQWVCDLTGHYAFDVVDSSEFNVSCGCSSRFHQAADLSAQTPNQHRAADSRQSSSGLYSNPLAVVLVLVVVAVGLIASAATRRARLGYGRIPTAGGAECGRSPTSGMPISTSSDTKTQDVPSSATPPRPGPVGSSPPAKLADIDGSLPASPARNTQRSAQVMLVGAHEATPLAPKKTNT